MYYYFISLLRNKGGDQKDISRFQEAFILGGISIDQLEKSGTLWKKGTTDPRNGTKFWTDCINVSMEQLMGNQEMLDNFKN